MIRPGLRLYHPPLFVHQTRPSTSNTYDLKAVQRYYEQHHAQRPSTSDTTDATEADFYMALPPPNVTGNLHIGHAVTATIEDAVCRYQEKLGKKVTWIPGFDHAGIATQMIVEKRLWKEKQLLRSQMSDEEFLRFCEEWKDERVADITWQLRSMSTTLDWTRQYYTMDKKFSIAVRRAFCQLHGEGLIFRDQQHVHWCPTLQSVISDQEVDEVEAQGGQWISVSGVAGRTRKIRVGVLHRVRYELAEPDRNDPKIVEVYTTRPETLYADIALAVNPNDDRLHNLIGKRVIHPLTRMELPIVGHQRVKPDFGTGILKITPAHDPVDFEVARECNLLGPSVSCIGKDGRIIGVPQYDGMDRFEARLKVLEELKAIGAYGGSSLQDRCIVKICSRSGDVIEPKPLEQWFLDTAEMHRSVLDALRRGEISIKPAFGEKHLDRWLNYEKPWCLSRQLAWGHRIPAYRTKDNRWLVADSEEVARRQTGYDGPLQPETDVLDTWFSSSLIPIVVRGWPAERIPSAVPLNLMETGHDIVGFWVARMLAVCNRLTGRLPFTSILLHGLIRDSSGRKMSKSLGNVIDPMDVIDGISLEEMVQRLSSSNLDASEIDRASDELRRRYPKGISACGADALRFALLRHDLTAADDVKIDITKFSDEGRRFCNKLWNLCKYASTVFDKVSPLEATIDSQHPVDLWIKSRLGAAMRHVKLHMDNMEPHSAFGALHEFLLTELCDVYLETTKKANWKNDTKRLSQIATTLKAVLDHSLSALSLFMPQSSAYFLDQTAHLQEISFQDLGNFSVTGVKPYEEDIAVDAFPAIVKGFPAILAVHIKPTDDYDLLGALEAKLNKAFEKEAKRAESLRKLAERTVGESTTPASEVDAATSSPIAEEVDKLRRAIEAVKSKKRTAWA
ncbi:valyl-tRNA synthetase family protein [Aphelenchoides avenae]|nr:valyl-tRNA synthetase family protein [Aphelenchus avenae]